MKLRVTEQGLVIPKELLEGIEEVDIQQQNGLILLVPTTRQDPILGLGISPVECNAPDASENHDGYIYGS